LLRDILFFEPERTGTDLKVALDHLNKAQKRRAIVFLVSDFHGTDYTDSLRRAARQHDLIAVRVADPREQVWPYVGLVRLEDAETGRQKLIDTGSRRFREGFAARAAERRAAFLKVARGAQADLIDVSTDGKHFDALLRFFRARDRRNRGR
jgi:uncharacterized protein (DUF58 family)